MEETEDTKASKTCSSEPWSCRGRTQPHQRQPQLPLIPHSFHNVFGCHGQYQKSPPLLPLPPPVPLQLPAILPPTQTQNIRSQTHIQKTAWKQKKPNPTSSSDTQVSASSVSQDTSVSRYIKRRQDKNTFSRRINACLNLFMLSQELTETE